MPPDAAVPGGDREVREQRAAAQDVVRRARAAPDVLDLPGRTGGTGSGNGTGTGTGTGTGMGTGTGNGTGTRPSHVWYASYGSNLLRERFEVYLLGGTVAGLDLVHPGGEGTAPASAEAALVLPGRLLTALNAPSWGGGGVAFWDPDGVGAGVLVRAWRVRLEQFLEVVHLENGGRTRQSAPWPAEVLSRGEARAGDGWYGRLVCPGVVAGEPVLTFTHPDPAALVPTVPSAAYRDVVHRGVVEAFGARSRGGLDARDAAAYVAGAL